MGLIRKSLPLLLLLLFGLILALYLALPGIAGRLVVRVFEAGTQCDVDLDNPKINLKELRASIDSVSIICRNEHPEDLFFAERISIGSTWSDLLEKRILLSPLEIKGARARSMTFNSSLIRTLDFILSKPEKIKKPMWYKEYLSFILDGWHVWVPEVQVVGANDEEGDLLFRVTPQGSEPLILRAFDLSFSSEDSVDHPEGVVLLKARSSRVLLEEGEHNIARELGGLDLYAEASSGVIEFKNTTFKLLANSEDKEADDEALLVSNKELFALSSSGTVSTKAERLDLQLSLKVIDKGIVTSLLPQLSDITGGEFTSAISIVGPYESPEIKTQSFAESLTVDPNKDWASCIPPTFSLEANFHDNEITISSLTIQDVISQGQIALLIDNGVKLSQVEPFNFSLDSEYLGRCFSYDPQMFSSAVKESSQRIISLKVPLSIKGHVVGEEKNINISLGEGDQSILDLNFQEINGVKEFDVALNWTADISSNEGSLFIHAKGEKDTSEFEMRDFSIKALSIPRLIAFLSPFIGNVRPLLPAAIFEDPYYLNLKGDLSFNTDSFETFSSDFKIALQSSKRSESLDLSVKGDKGNTKIIGFLNGIQTKPFIDLEARGKNLNGNLNINTFEAKQIPLFASLLKSGRHYLGFSGDIRGELFRPDLDIEMNLESHRGAPTDPVILQSLAKLITDGSGKNFNANIFDQSLEVECGSVNQNPEAPSIYDCNIDLIKFPVRFFLESDSGDIRESTISGLITYRGTYDIYKGLGRISLEAISLPEAYGVTKLTSPIEVKLANQELRLTPLTLNFADEPLLIDGRVSKDKGWDASIRGKWLLGELVTQFRALESISGELDIDIAIGGAFDAPMVNGEIRIDEAGFSLPMGEGIIGGDSISGSLVLSGDVLELKNISGEFGEGRFILQGSVASIFSVDERNGIIKFRANEVGIEPVSGLSLLASVSTDLIFTPLEKPIIRGEVSLDDAIYESALNIENVLNTLTSLVLSGFRVRSKSGEVLSDSGFMLDLEVKAPAGLYLDTSVLQAEFFGGLRLTDDLLAPSVAGEIKVVDGEFKINQTEFRIISGKATFDSRRGGLNPSLNLVSEGELRALSGETQRIYLTLGGTLRTPRVNLTSDGQASTRELAQQLGVGGGPSQVKLIDERNTKVGFREVLNPASELSLAERFVGITGFDDVRLETVVAARTGEFVPQVVGGRPLLYDLRGIISTELSGDRANAARVEYQLNDVLTTFTGWRSQSVTNPSTTSAANFLLGVRFDETFKGFSFFQDRLKEVE